MSSIYQKAWQRFVEELERKAKEGKTGWGYREIKELMLRCLVEVSEE